MTTIQRFHCNITVVLLSCYILIMSSKGDLSLIIGKYWTLSYPIAVINSVLSNIKPLISALWPYLIILLSFVAFLLMNGSIVMGDKNSHQPRFHLPQLFYFSVFSCAFSSPHLLFNPRLMGGFRHVLTIRLKWVLAFVFITVAGAAAVYLFT